MLSGEIALKNNYYYHYMQRCMYISEKLCIVVIGLSIVEAKKCFYFSSDNGKCSFCIMVGYILSISEAYCNEGSVTINSSSNIQNLLLLLAVSDVTR